MKLISISALLIFSVGSFYGQKSEDLIPVDAVTVFSLNNIALFQKVSLDELVTYEFMQEVQQELFDGSTSGKSIQESGIDFDQKLNIYYGKNENYEVAGFSFGIKDKNQLFTVFDDFDKQVSTIENVEYYSSYFNHLLIRDNVGLLIRVDPVNSKVRELTDSIWYAKGYDYVPYNYDSEYDYEESATEVPPMDEEWEEDAVSSPVDAELEEENEAISVDEELKEETEAMPVDEEWEEEAESVEGWDEGVVVEGNPSDEPYDVEEAVEVMEEGDEYIYEEDVESKNYNELKDSVYASLQVEYMDKITQDLFVNDQNLKKQDKDLAELLTHSSEGVFYLDNSRNVMKSQRFWYFEAMLPTLHNEIKELYSGNKIMGDLVLNNNSIEAKMTANYGEALGSIYKSLNDTKFDKNITKYIHKDNSAYFTYNVNLKNAYEKAYEIVMPLLRDEKNVRVATSVLTIELLNALIDKDALFDTYRGSMFGTFNGVKKVMVKRINYDYDEDFNYKETEVESEEDMPIFTLGFSTKRNDLPEIVLKQLEKVTSECKNKGDYWKFDNVVLSSLPLYIINKNDLFILTNDENLAVNHSNGFGSEKLSRKQIKKTKQSGFVYGEIDWSKTIAELPREIFTQQQNELLDAMRGKTGNMTITSSKTTNYSTNFTVNYGFNGTYDNPGKYVLDLVNSLYIIMK